ncbi:hypothetical protein, partial [Bifidobacterium sp. AGR2158]|uniref:hypothetical protein n=1 Tax=Bifidobacterium sp. AGR2158 TaxID=1280675 RepID=UPI0005537E0F
AVLEIDRWGSRAKCYRSAEMHAGCMPVVREMAGKATLGAADVHGDAQLWLWCASTLTQVYAAA